MTSIETEITKHSSILYVHGPSRSGTTITEISLGQIADLTFSQPFTSTIYKQTGLRSGYVSVEQYEEAIRRLFDAILKVKNETKKEKLLVVVKEVNDRLPLELFSRWLEVPTHTLVTLRDPHVQLMSMMRQNGMSFFGLEDRPSIDEVFNSLLPKFETAPMGDSRGRTFLEFYRDKWISLETEIRSIRQLTKNLTIFDTTVLRHDPHQTLVGIFSRLKIDVPDVSVCVSGFKGRSFRFIDLMERNRTATQTAYMSDGLKPLDRAERVLPERFDGYCKGVLDIARPIYQTLMRAPEIAYTPTRQEAESQSWMADEGVTLMNVHPFTAESAIQP